MGLMKAEYYPHYTYDDYSLWEGDWELINGIAYAMAPAPMIKHQNLSNKIAWQLQEQLKTCTKCQALLPVDWKINDETIVQPDNLVIYHTPMYEAYLSKAPKIIFEILSKSTATKDKNLKYDLYEREGVQYYIIVDPDENMAKVYTLNSEGKYKKVADVSDEKIAFTIEACPFTFDFSKIW